MATKRVVFISRSKLAHNLFEMVVRTIPRKVEFMAFDSLEGLSKNYFPKVVQLLILDQSCLPVKQTEECLKKCFSGRAFKTSKKMFIYSREKPFDHDVMQKNGFKYLCAKPFLPDELLDMIAGHLGVLL